MSSARLALLCFGVVGGLEDGEQGGNLKDGKEGWRDIRQTEANSSADFVHFRKRSFAL